MKRSYHLAGWAFAGMLAAGQPALANQIAFKLSGDGVSSSGIINFAPDPIAGNQPTGPVSPNPVTLDPAGANNLTGISGTFSDSSPTLVGSPIVNATITGLVPTSPTPKVPFPDGFVLATSLSHFPASNLPTANHGALSYDNLFFPLGAPDTCDDGITGGYTDVFGWLFTLNNGDIVDVWSDGGGPNDSAIYGVAVLAPNVGSGYTAIDYTAPDNTGVNTLRVPEPSSVWLLGAGLLGLFGWRGRSGGAGRKLRTASLR